MSTPAIAAGLYGNTAQLAGGLASKAPSADQIAPVDFGSMVSDAVNNVTELGRAAEATQVDMLQGKANLVDVVTAVAETEVALETMVSLRDRVISAYEEIMRMPI